MKKNGRYDAHCHVFSRNIVTKRLVLMAIDALKSYNINFTPNAKAENKKNLDKFLEFFLTNKNSEAVVKDISNLYAKAESGVDKYMALMLDLKFCFQEKYEQNEHEINENVNKHFVTIFKELKKEKRELSKKIELTKTIDKSLYNQFKQFSESTKDFDDYQIDSILHKTTHSTKSGFSIQLNEMEDLKRQLKDNFYPFLAVDPRRKDIKKLIIKYVGKGKVFSGIKLYAPNGYSPTDPVLFESKQEPKSDEDYSIYQYCINNRIPIIAHCSSGGFSNLVQQVEIKGLVMPDAEINDDTQPIEPLNGLVKFNTNFIADGFFAAVSERARVLNHPNLWRIVLDKYKELTIDLAHFGGNSEQWRKAIFKLMIAENEDGSLKYPYLYTDLSCITDEQMLKTVKKEYYNKASSEVKAKFMYGSDFYLNLMWSKSFTDYFEHFTKVFGNEMNKISINNPTTFLFGEFKKQNRRNKLMSLKTKANNTNIS